MAKFPGDGGFYFIVALLKMQYFFALCVLVGKVKSHQHYLTIKKIFFFISLIINRFRERDHITTTMIIIGPISYKTEVGLRKKSAYKRCHIYIPSVTANELNSEATKQLHKINCSIESGEWERESMARPHCIIWFIALFLFSIVVGEIYQTRKKRVTKKWAWENCWNGRQLIEVVEALLCSIWDVHCGNV